MNTNCLIVFFELSYIPDLYYAGKLSGLLRDSIVLRGSASSTLKKYMKQIG